MLATLLLTSSILLTGGTDFHGGPGGPATGNTRYFTNPRVGLSSQEEVLQMWGKPATEKVEKDHAICTWPRGKKTVILTFNTQLDVLVNWEVVKNK